MKTAEQVLIAFVKKIYHEVKEWANGGDDDDDVNGQGWNHKRWWNDIGRDLEKQMKPKRGEEWTKWHMS